MTAVLFDYPKNAAFGRVLPKNKIYEHGSVSSAVRQLFVRQVEQIVWQHKLAPETVNLKASKAVPEIQIFSITLKGDELKPEVLITGNGPGENAAAALKHLKMTIFINAHNLTIRQAYENYKNGLLTQL